MLQMPSVEKSTPRSSKKRRHSHDGDLTPTSQTPKSLTHPSSQGKKSGKNRKRAHEEVAEESAVSRTSIIYSPDRSSQTLLVKRARNKPIPSESSDQDKEGLTSGLVNLPGQKVAILAMIRQRLAELNDRTLYVRKLPRNTTMAQLKTLCPTSINARLPSKGSSNRRRYAFIEFKSKELAVTALQSISGKLVADRPIKVQLCSERTKVEHPTGPENNVKYHPWTQPEQRQLQEFSLTTLYISCIPRSTMPDEVRELFPNAVSFDFNMHPKNKGIGSCRVTFSSEQDAFQAFTSKHNAILRECPIIVNFAFKKNKLRSIEHVPERKIHPENIQTSKKLAPDQRHAVSLQREQKPKEEKKSQVQQPSSNPQEIKTHSMDEAKPKKPKKHSLNPTTKSSVTKSFLKQPKVKKHKMA